MVQLSNLKKELRAIATPQKAKALAWFFKSGPGQYAESDKFLGVAVPEQRKVAKQFEDLPLKDVERLITSPWHEERLTGLFILIGQFRKADTKYKKLIYEFYVSHTKWINNWDLVDSSAPYIVGPWLEDKPNKMNVLKTLAKSKLLWDKRIAMLATFHYTKNGSPEETMMIAELLLYDSHDLIQKAVGWMLREVGKRVSEQTLTDFLNTQAATMPRTSLHYAIEKLAPQQRHYYMQLKTVKRV